MKLYKRLVIILLILLTLISFIYPIFYTEERFIELLEFFGLLN